MVNDDTRPTIVGERTNVLGSRRFKRLIAGERFEEAAEIGRRQVRNGAHILDVCLQDPDRDETSDVIKFLDQLNRRVKAPIMIDSTDAAVIEEALKRLQGKSIINSVNLEDGEERFQRVVPLARRYGAALVVGCIDDDPTRRRPSPARASWKSPSAPTACSPKNTACRSRTSSLTLCVSRRHRR